MNLAEKYGIDLSKEHKTQCPRCAKNGRDRNRNNLHVYGEDKGAHCFACAFTIPSLAHMEENGWVDDEDEEEVVTQDVITQEEAEKIKGYTTLKGYGTRGISDETYAFYAVRHKLSEETGKPVAQYYPITEEYARSGYKVRKLPKEFSTIGRMCVDSDLFGQWKHKNATGRFVVITAGEIDAMSGHQILEAYRQSKGSDFDPVPVVSGVLGEGGSAKQIQKQYDWFNRFQKIIICYDQDAAGEKAVKKIAKVLPKGKVFIMTLPMKDTNAMLEAGKNKQWISCFYDAKPYTPDGIVSSAELGEKIRLAASMEKMGLPPFMHELEKMMAGGIPLKVIINLASASGTGKSTIVDEMMYHWIFHSPYKIGTVTLESDSGQYGTKILSRHLGVKIDLIDNVEEKLAYLDSEEVLAAEQELYFLPDGTPRFYLIEERDGGIDSLKELIMNLIIACDCQIIILDPLQDILDGLGNEGGELFMKWMKGMVKSHDVTFINVNHVRKSGNQQKANSTGADMHEEDIHGSGSILKSGACNLLFSRNKEAEDPIERNTTKMKATKIRWTGATGVAGEYFYENETHTLWDLNDYMAAHPAGF